MSQYLYLLKFLFLVLCITIIGISALATHFALVTAAISHTTAKIFDSITMDKSVHGVAAASNLTTGNTSVINYDVITLNNLQSRDDLLNNISSYNDLHKILAKFRNFTGTYASYSAAHATMNGSNGSSITNITTVPSRSIVIYYSWDLEKVDREKYSILMLKFTNSTTGELPTKRTDYNIMIKNGTHILLQKNGTTFTGTDLKIIGIPVDGNMQINVTRFNDNVVNEHVLLPKSTIQTFFQNVHIENKTNLVSNPNLVHLYNQSGSSTNWNGSFNDCNNDFKCTITSTTGLKGNTSFQVSTYTTNKNIWSYITGKAIDVKPGERYELVTYMKLNNYATQSHIVIEAYNQTSKKWNPFTQCPSGTNGPLEWHGYSCEVTIPSNTIKIRPVLNAGWSSQENKEAVTWFDGMYLFKLADFCIEPCRTPSINDPNLKAELVYKGLLTPTTMAFLGPNDFLVLEKNKGTVQRIVNGVELKKPVLDVPVAAYDGLLGIAISTNTSHIPPTTYVFLYFTESGGGKTGDDVTAGIKPKCDCLYRYELINDKLVNPKLLLHISSGRGTVQHNGGIIKIGPDNNVYIIVGSLNATLSRNKALNFADGADPDGRAGVLRVMQDGKPVGKGILGDKFPLNLYYGYGIRNSFGMGFDPISKKLWDTENGPASSDEINLVEPGFNSGWGRMMGFWQVDRHESVIFKNTTIPNDLEDFGGKGKYRSPAFTWNQTVAPTAITFLNSDKLGKKYQNDMFVADANYGNIYHFKLNQNRTGLLLNGSLADKVAHSPEELQGTIFATGFGLTTDLEVGPDGYLYVVAFNEGKIYRIVPWDKSP